MKFSSAFLIFLCVYILDLQVFMNIKSTISIGYPGGKLSGSNSEKIRKDF